MRGAIAALVICFGASSTAAYAVDWSINSTVSESIELNDNQFLKPVPAGTVGSYTSLSSIFTARTPTTRFDFTPDFTYRKYWGPGTQGQTLTETRDEGARLHFENVGKGRQDREYVDAYWHQTPLAFALLNNLGVPSNSTATLNTSNVAVGIDRSITATDFLTLNAQSTSTDYQPTSAGTHFLDSVARASFRHQSNQTAALTASSELEWLTFANVAHTNLYILREMAGLDVQPLRGLSFVGSAGAAIVSSQQGSAGGSSPSTNSSRTTAGLIADILVTYQLLSTTQLSFRAVQSISPSVVGSLTQLTSFDLTLRHSINQASAISVSGDASRQIVSGGQSDFLSASVTYSYQLAREWSSSITYRFLHTSGTTAASSPLFDPITGVPTIVVNSSGQAANSNSILMVLSKSFTVLPSGQ